MKELQGTYRVLVSIWREGDTSAESYKFKTEMCDDKEELFESIENYTSDTLDQLEEGNDDSTDITDGI